MITQLLRIALIATAAVLTLSSNAWAADGPEISSLGQIARLIKWGGVATSVLVVIGAWLGMRFLRDSVTKLSKRFLSQRLLLEKIATFAQFSVYITTGLTVVVLSFELNESVITLIGGTVAVSVGFAIKDLVASFIAGMMIMVDRPFQVGDRVTFGGEYGDITAIGLRSVRLQTLDDNTVTIPNNKFLKRHDFQRQLRCARHAGGHGFSSSLRTKISAAHGTWSASAAFPVATSSSTSRWWCWSTR